MIKRIKYLILLFLFLFPMIINAGTFSSDTSKANNYLLRDTFSSSYKKYLLYSNLKFGFNNGKPETNGSFTMGGFISEGEYKLTIPNKGSSYLLTGDSYWTLTPDGSKYKVIEFNGGSNTLGSYESSSTRPKARVTEYVSPSTSVSGTGKQTDPWIFDPMFRVNFKIPGIHAKIEGSTEELTGYEKGATLSNIYLRAKCKEESCTKTIKLIIDEGYDVVSETCDGTYDPNNKTYTVNNITKDVECNLTIGIGEFHVNLIKGDWEESPGPTPSGLYLRQRDNYYREKEHTNIIYKLDRNPERYGYTFKGYLIPETTIRIIDNTGKIIDKTSIKKDEQNIISDWQKNIYTITFNPNGGKINANEVTKQVTFDEAYGVLPLATRAGYSFKGWYTSASNNEQIKSTDILKYAGNRTLYAQWVTCPIGTYNTGDSTTCTSCPTGYTSAQGSTAENQCYMIVPTGKYLVAKGSSALPCDKGTYRSGQVTKYYGESISCTNCAAGTYQDTAGQTSCKTCPTGYTSNIKAQADTACFMKVSPGYYLVAKASSTTKCAAGTFRSTEVTKNYGQGVNCDTCTPGTTSSAGASSCTTCSNNAHVASWTSGCTIKTCESAYALHNNTCVLACSSVTYQNGTTCTKKCGSGTYNRLAYSAYDGRRCSANDQSSGGSACNTQACCSSVTYQNGTTCTKKCGSGTYNRLAYSAYDGSRCSANDQSSGGSACNTQACCSSVTYQNGSTCTKKCGSGTYNRLAYSAYDGSRCSANDQSSGGSACNTQACCSSTTTSYGNWSGWGTCTKKCGTGSQTRTRTVTTTSTYDGSVCSTSTETGSQSCNTQTCCSSTTTSYGNWSGWSGCSASCGGGSQTRTRTVTKTSTYDGSVCSTSTETGSQSCNTQLCPCPSGQFRPNGTGACTPCNRWYCENCSNYNNCSSIGWSSQNWIYYDSSCNRKWSGWVWTGASNYNPDNDPHWWFYFEGGYMKVGWVKDGGYWYYLHNGPMNDGSGCKSGRMYQSGNPSTSSSLNYNGTTYYFDSSGRCTNNNYGC